MPGNTGVSDTVRKHRRFRHCPETPAFPTQSGNTQVTYVYGISAYFTQKQRYGLYPHWTERGGVICVDSATIGHSKYRHDDFAASDHVEKIVPKPGVPLDKYTGIFLEAVLGLETFRYGYGRKFNQARIRNTKLLLPRASGTGEPDWRRMRDYIRGIDRLSWMRP